MFCVKKILIYSINFYRKHISPFTNGACKFQPTCSEYALKAINKYGVFKAIFLIVWRILRCNPFSKGGIDDIT